MIEAFFTLLGTAIGFLLSEWAQSRREKREDERVKLASMTVVRAEMDLDLGFLGRYQEIADTFPQEQQEERAVAIPQARKALAVPFPPFSRQAFDTQLQTLGKVLSSEQLNASFGFYNNLMKLESILNALAQALHDQETEWARASGGQGVVAMTAALGMRRRFDRDAPALWSDFISLVQELSSAGNPLAEAARSRYAS